MKGIWFHSSTFLICDVCNNCLDKGKNAWIHWRKFSENIIIQTRFHVENTELDIKQCAANLTVSFSSCVTLGWLVLPHPAWLSLSVKQRSICFLRTLQGLVIMSEALAGKNMGSGANYLDLNIGSAVYQLHNLEHFLTGLFPLSCLKRRNNRSSYLRVSAS